MKTESRQVVVAEVSGSSSIEQLRGDWERLLAAYGTPSFFLSWLWIGNWIKILPPETQLHRVTVYRGDLPEALTIVTSQTVRRKGLFSSRVLALNESLAAGFDMVVEYNGLVGNRADSRVYKSMLSGLIDQFAPWDELQLSAIAEADLFLDESILQALKLSPRVVGESYARFVDLAQLRKTQSSFVGSLKKKTRYKIRRYLRAIEQRGQIQVSTPNTVDEALCFFDELKALHQTYWQQRGKSGSFANVVWERFHHNIIRDGFDDGAIQLVKVAVGSEVVGVVYSLVASGTINMIQSGYNYHAFPNEHPGYVSLVKVIEYNLDAGNDVFDFLVGDAQYKQSLATDAVKLKWVMLQRHRVKLSFENFLRDVKHKIAGDSDITF